MPAVGPILARWAAFFKSHRPLLGTGDVIHVKRPDGQGLDVVLHARAGLALPGLLVVTNPTPDAITVAALTVPLHYTGLDGSASVAFGGVSPVVLPLDWRRRVVLANVTVPGRGVLWADIAPGS